MAKGKIRNCKVTFNQFNKYKSDYKGMGRCVLGIIKTICENKPDITYTELLNIFPDELADHGGKFIKHPYVIKKRSDIEDSDIDPKKRICINDPITTKKDGITFYVSRGWNGHLQDSNFYYFCDAAKKNFDIDVQLLN